MCYLYNGNKERVYIFSIFNRNMIKKGLGDVDGTEAVSIDLYSLIYSVKKEHFADYGINKNLGCEERMINLEYGKPEERLLQSRLAREIVRILLNAKDRCGSGSLDEVIEGNDPRIKTNGAIVFSDISDYDVKPEIYALQEDGLLELWSDCFYPSWCLASEPIYYKEKVCGVESKNISRKFEVNQKLREALVMMLKPFEGEEPMYVRSVWGESRPRYHSSYICP